MQYYFSFEIDHLDGASRSRTDRSKRGCRHYRFYIASLPSFLGFYRFCNCLIQSFVAKQILDEQLSSSHNLFVSHYETHAFEVSRSIILVENHMPKYCQYMLSWLWNQPSSGRKCFVIWPIRMCHEMN